MDKSKILAGEAPVERNVTFHDGTESVLHFKQPTAADFRRWQLAEQSDDNDAKVYAQQRLVAASLCDENGKLALTQAEALRLTLHGLKALFPHVLVVAGIDDAAKKDSPSADTNGSDMSSD